MDGGAIRRIASGGIYEDRIGYCRAVVAGGMVHVSGTVAPGPNPPDTAAAQCRAALGVIGEALERAGSGWDRVVRVRYILPDPEEFESCWPVLRETFGPNPPAATMIAAGLIDPRYRIEIEVDAVL